MSSLVGTRENRKAIEKAIAANLPNLAANLLVPGLASSFMTSSNVQQKEIIPTIAQIVPTTKAGIDKCCKLSIILNRYNSKFITNPFGAPFRGADGDELSFYLSDPQYYIEVQRYFS